MSQEFFCFVKRTGDDVNADEFSNAAGCDRTPFSRGFHGTHIAANQDGDVAVEEVMWLQFSNPDRRTQKRNRHQAFT